MNDERTWVSTGCYKESTLHYTTLQGGSGEGERYRGKETDRRKSRWGVVREESRALTSSWSQVQEGP
jgi:hypothetical protein